MSDLIDAVRRLVKAGGRGILVTVTDGPEAGSMTLVSSEGVVLAGPPVPDRLGAMASEAPETKGPTVITEGGTTWFVEPIAPPPRMIVLGAISVADALIPMAAQVGFEVEVIDPRPWLAVPERHPGARAVHCGVPAEVLADLEIDGSTAIVSFLHEPGLEDAVLAMALGSPAVYVGSMGSRRTTEAKRERLAAAGVEPDRLARLAAPIGLDIGGVTPAEIAVAILAEVVATMRGAR